MKKVSKNRLLNRNLLSLLKETDSLFSYQETMVSYKSVTKEDDEYSESLYTSQSQNSASSIVASPEPPLYSDIENPLVDCQDMPQVNDYRRSEVREEYEHEESPISRTAYTNDLCHTNVSPPTRIESAVNPYTIPDTIHELPAEPPARSRARPHPYRGLGSRSSSTLSNLDHIGARSPSLPNPPVTPLSPNLPSPLAIRPPWPKAISPKSSYSSIKVPLTHFQVEQVEVCSTRKAKFLNGRKRADYVSLSPDCTHAAFVFSDQIQICRDVSDWEGAGRLEAEVMLKLEKKAGKYIAACVSDAFLVAISDKQVRNLMLDGS